MFGLRRLFPNEKGQGTTEAVLVLPLFILTLVACVQFAWVIFSQVTVNYAITHTEWTLTEEQVLNSTDHNALIKQEILDSSFGLVADNLTISNADIEIQSPVEVTKPVQNPQIDVVRQVSRQQYMDINADVVYSVPMIFHLPGIDDFEYTLHVDKTNVIFSQFEVF